MKHIIFKVLLLVFILQSCSKPKEQVFISNYNISVTGDSSQETSLFILHLKNDSLFYLHFDSPQFKPNYLGKLKHNKFETEIDKLSLEYFKDSLKLYSGNIKYQFKELKEKTTNAVLINKDYFIGKEFMVNTKRNKTLIKFIDEKSGYDLSNGSSFEWDLIEFEGYYFLWNVAIIDRFPLFIKNITGDTIFTQLFTKDEVLNIIFTENEFY
ncbi:hypothetical protein [uncultured Planktosalinus sp.]|uniref:hypothetical protein n=1 Tax=uncultured Planktosalinus sp. TaxID=1810935 RepID=UPI0030D99DCD